MRVPVRHRLVVAVAAVMVVAAGCSADPDAAGPGEATQSVQQPPIPDGPPTFIPSDQGGQAGEPPGPPPTDADAPPSGGPTDLPPRPPTTPDEQVLQESRGAVASGNEAGGTDLAATSAYIAAIVDSAHRSWSAWFAQAGYPTPYVVYYTIQPGQTRTESASCALSGQVQFTSDYPNAFYCRDRNDAYDYGHMVFPVQTMAKMWNGDIFGRSVQNSTDLKRVGDFAAGVIIAHEFGHHVVDELQVASGRPAPVQPQSELIADCFAGVYAYALNLGGGLEAGDVDEAINALQAVGDNPGSHGSGPQRENAFRIGLYGTQTDPRGGVPLTCLQAYWPGFVS